MTDTEKLKVAVIALEEIRYANRVSSAAQGIGMVVRLAESALEQINASKD